MVLIAGRTEEKSLFASIMNSAASSSSSSAKVDTSQLNQREFQKIFETKCDSDFQTLRMFVKYVLLSSAFFIFFTALTLLTCLLGR